MRKTIQYWLMKSEPALYSIDDLARDAKTCWDGVRNFQARNYMRDTMQIGDLALFYHSGAEPSGAVGVMQVCSGAYPDFTAWDSQNDHFDPQSTPELPRWFMVDVAFVEKFPHVVTLEAIKAEPHLQGILVAKRGMRLSIQPVSKEHFEVICEMGRK